MLSLDRRTLPVAAADEPLLQEPVRIENIGIDPEEAARVIANKDRNISCILQFT
jgi:hypothetical protein